MTSPDLPDLPHPIADDTDATTWASGYQPGDTVDWRAMEIAAVSSYPRIRAELDRSGRYNGGRRHQTTNRLVLVPTIIWAVALVGAPVLAYAILFSERLVQLSADLDWTYRLPVAAFFFGLAFVFLAVLLVRWMIRGRHSSGFLLGYSGVVLALGGLSSVGVLASEEERRMVPLGDLWLAVVLATTALGLVSLVVVALGRSRAAEAKASEFVEPATREFNKLPENERRSIRADLERALDDLAARNVIDDGAAERARQAEPGLLALEMSQYRG